MNEITTLTKRAMVANLSIGIWQGYRLDKAASQKITTQSNAHADAARVNKHLIPKEALKAVVTASGAIRTHFYDNTLPWRDNGDRLLTRKLYLKFIEEHEGLVHEFTAAVEKFITQDYPSAIEQAEFRMGALFNRSDYPTASELRRKFYVSLDIDAITTAGDFRVELDQEHVDRIQAEMNRSAEQRANQAMQDVWKRLAETVGYFQERMANPKAVFRDSTVNNLAELVEMIPGLNVLDDPEIEQLRLDVKKHLTGIDPKDIRKDDELRGELAGSAKEIMDKVQGFMTAFGNGEA